MNMEKHTDISADNSKQGVLPLRTRNNEGTGGIQIDVENLSYRIKNKQEVAKKILHDISFKMVPKSLTGLMGPSGSGKSTLLDLLADRKIVGDWSGEIYFNNGPRSKFLYQDSAYIMQDDLQISTLTVREAITFSANFRMREGTSEVEMAERVEKLIELMSLQSVANSFVGDAMTRGISGGELKRLSIAVEMVALPHLVYLDEPTSGLDSTMALDVIQTVRRLADDDRTCIASIHQPSKEVFALFDYVLILGEGRMIYFGAVSEVERYFCEDVFQYGMERGLNPADFVLEVSEGLLLPSSKHIAPLTAMELEQAYKTSTYRYKMESMSPKEQCVPLHYEEEEELKEESKKNNNMNSKNGKKENDDWRKIVSISWWLSPRKRIHATTKWSQFKLLMYRNYLDIIRNRSVTYAYLAYQVFTGLLMGSITFGQGSNVDAPLVDDENGFPDSTVNNISSFFGASLFFIQYSNVIAVSNLILKCLIFRREVAAYSYAVSSYWLAHCICVIPLQLIGLGIYVIISYSLAGFTCNFGIYYSILTFTSIVSYYFAMFVASIYTNLQIATTLYMISFSFLSLFTGSLINVGDVSQLWIWAPYINFGRWMYEGLMVNQWSKYDDDSVQESVLDSYDFSSSYDIATTYWVAMGFSIAFIFGVYWNLRPPENKLQKISTIEMDKQDPATENMTTTSPLLSEKKLERQKLQENLLGKKEKATEEEGTKTFRNDDTPRFHDGNSLPSNQNSILSNAGTTGGAQQSTETAARITLTFEDVSYVIENPTPSGTVKENTDALTTAAAKESLCILHHVSGIVQPNEMCALMGTSGAGKSTLLDVLALRKTIGTVKGEICMNGYRMTKEMMMRRSAYVVQSTDHIYSPHLTVRETLEFASHFLLEERMTLEEKAARVKEFLYILRLENVAESIVGDEATVRGISGGQRRRVLIGAEIMHLPSLLYLDEPTTGLDSVSANELVSILRLLANQHRTILCTIHQPSEACFRMFDKVMLLAKGGKMVYFGDVDKMKEYFETSIYRFVYDDRRNVADFVLDIASGMMSSAGASAESNKRDAALVSIDEINEMYKSSSVHFSLQQEIQQSKIRNREVYVSWGKMTETEEARQKQQSENTDWMTWMYIIMQDQWNPPASVVYPTSTWFQIKTLLSRVMLERKRSPFVIIAPFVRYIWTSFLYGTTFFQLDDNYVADDDSNAHGNDYRYRITFFGMITNLIVVAHLQDLTEIDASRVFVIHELSSQKYSPIASWCSYAVVKTLLACVNTFIYSLLAYQLAGLHNSEVTGGDSYFFYFVLVLTLTDIISVFFAMTIYNFSPSVGVGTMVYVIAVSCAVLFEGYIFYLPNFPAWISWLAYFDYIRYAFQGLILNEFYYNSNALPEANNYVHELGFEGLSRGSIVVILLCMLLVMMIISAGTYRQDRFMER